KPGRPTRSCHQRGCESGKENHCDCTRPEAHIHGRWADPEAQENKDGRDEKSYLDGAAERNTDTQVEVIFACGRESSSHFGRCSDKSYYDETDESRCHSKCKSCLLNRSDKYLADHCYQDGDSSKSSKSKADRPRCFTFMRFAREQLAMRVEREHQAECVCNQQQ